MTKLFATLASRRFVFLVLLLNQAVFVQILVIFADVSAELAPKLIFVGFAAAPPHRATPLGLVRPARPVEIIRVCVLLRAVFA